MSRACLMIFLGLALLALAGPARAVVRHQPTVADLDQDQDGRISKKEYLQGFTDKKAAAEHFDKLDRDRDGYLTKKDVLALFKMVDTDHDGRISKKEAEKHWKTYPDLWDGYGTVDGNRDGWWSADEAWGLYPGNPIFWW